MLRRRDNLELRKQPRSGKVKSEAHTTLDALLAE